jgi:RHS repeat-associated protein
LALSNQELRADVGGNNPTGPSGFFNGNITTGRDSYDPLTGNMVHVANDITVAGAVGSYGLSFTRVSNSRSSIGWQFGLPGAWRHSYEWLMDDSLRTTSQLPPTRYSVQFPDGRWEYFQSSPLESDPSYYRAAPGTRERLIRMDQNHRCYLILADGGKVEFQGTLNSEWDPETGWEYWWSFQAQAIIDPYGLRTTFTYTNGLLTKVTEPAGRSITINYGTRGAGDVVIISISASDGRSVQYNYGSISPGGRTYTALTSVVYYGNASWTTRYQYRAPNVGSADGIPLLRTADDPMYPGPMKRIAYEYKTGQNADTSSAVYGQIYRERYWDGVAGHEGTGAIVSTLAVGTNGITNNPAYRMETRGDGATRTFTYSTSGYKLTWTDFMSHSASKTYDTNKYVNSVIDFNGHTTNYTNNAITGNVTVITFPLTQGDTPGQTARPTVRYTYGWAGCADTNNTDANNPYWLCSAADEGGHVTQFYRNINHRVTRIDYADGGYETFTYNSFGQVLSHRMTTGGTETFTYNARGLKQTYSDPYHSDNNPPSIHYYYDTLDRVSGMVDALNHSTNFDYNNRGQLTVTTLPWINATRYTITNAYNADGTLRSKTDELGHVTSYTYDDYKRVKSVTPPARGDGTGTHTTSFYYGANPWDGLNDYQFTDLNVTWGLLPTGKKTNTVYDDNRRKSTVTVGYGTADAATTSYTYDNVGNLTTVTNPRSYHITTAYDERNRPSSITDALNDTTTFTYDTAGRKKSITRPNGQVITYASFDEMNRVTQQNATQSPTGTAITKYTYYPSGLLQTMQDPHLVQLNNGQVYTYAYDLMGRKTRLTYPIDSGIQRTEQWGYDTVGRLYQFTNRAGKTQTFTYDALNRVTGFSWNDGLTPSVTFDHDAASRLVEIDNANATISRQYWNDNSLRSETETVTGGVARTVSYTYDEDRNRATLQIPGYTFTYDYTNRNQLKHIMSGGTALATYVYDENGYVGDLTTRSLANGTQSTYLYDPLDRVTWLTHSLNGTTRTFNYGYYDNSDNRRYVRRLGSPQGDVGDAFRYDLADQAIGFDLNVLQPQSVDPGSIPWGVGYDPNGNRLWFTAIPYDTANNLNQYTAINGAPLTYTLNGSLAGYNGASYSYDAQTRLTSATVNGATMNFKYDGLNRQVSRTVGGVSSYSVWEGWDLVEEYQMPGPAVQARYLHGPTGPVKNLTSGNYYYQDASGSTSHLADGTGHLLEWYRYDLQGTPIINDDPSNNVSAYGVRHLFTGQQWYSELGLYDLRNRFYAPGIGRFLQPDPVDFDGDPTNLYRYCANNPIKFMDPSGLWQFTAFGGDGWGVLVTVGHNSAQWNFGIFGGVGSGFAASLDLSDSGAHASGGSINFTGSTGVGNGLIGGRLNINTGRAGNTFGATGRLWRLSGGVQKNVDTGDVRLTGPSVTAGGGGFGGPGFVYYSSGQPQLPPAPPPPGGTTEVDPDCGPGCVTLERVTVTGTVPPDVSGGGGGYYYGGYGGYFPGPGGTYGGYAGYGVYGSVGGYTFDSGTHIGGVLAPGFSPFWPSFYNAGGAAGSAELLMERGLGPKDL